MTQAQGIAPSMGAGSLEFLEDGAWTERMHPGLGGIDRHYGGGPGAEGFVEAAARYEDIGFGGQIPAAPVLDIGNGYPFVAEQATSRSSPGTATPRNGRSGC